MSNNFPNTLIKSLLFSACLLALANCSDSNTDFFKTDKPQSVTGERVTIINAQPTIEVSDSMTEIAVSIPNADKISNWSQNMGNNAHQIDNIALSSTLAVAKSMDAGDGNAWQGNIIAAPIIQNNILYSLDGEGITSARSLADTSNILWKQQIGTTPDSALNGGGLASDEHQIYATTAQGYVTALQAEDGKVIWNKILDLPIRSAPLVTENNIIVMTAGSQLYALDKQTGDIIWQHRGIQETASLLGTVTPAYSNGLIVAAYPSGEVYALQANDGKVAWSDSLLLPERTSALGTFSGVSGMPVIKDDAVFTVSSNGLLIANQLSTGMRIWELPVSSANTPWIAGEFMYIITTNGQLASIYLQDGRIKWLADIPDFNATKEDQHALIGPLMVDGKLIIMRSNGQWQQFNPMDGSLSLERDVTSGYLSLPAFSDAAMFIINQNATLYMVH